LNYFSQISPTIGICFDIHLKTGTKCFAYSQQGLLEVDSTRVYTFRAEDARETNMRVKGINSHWNCSNLFSKDMGERPTKMATMQHCKHRDMIQNCRHSKDSAVHREMVVVQDELLDP